MKIGQTPCFSIRDIINGRKKKVNVFPFNSKNCHFFFSARYALWGGLKILGITSAHNILIPSYNCGTEIDPILDHKIQVKFYTIKQNMAIDMEDLKRQIDSRTAAILVIHYLGFPQPIHEIKEICETKGLFLIEDCAHAFMTTYKSKSVGTFGDISIFSLRKTLPIPNGGVLVINNEKLRFEEKLKRPNLLSTFFISVELIKNRTTEGPANVLTSLLNIMMVGIVYINYILKIILRIIKKLFSYESLSLIHVNYYEFSSGITKWKISKLAERIMGNTDYEKVKDTRRRNYEYLLNKMLKLKNIKVIFDNLPPGVCPLFFPIIVKDREGLYERFKEKDIVTHQFWKFKHKAVPWDEFPQAVFLKEYLLGLPIHQDIGISQLDKIIEVLKGANYPEIK